MASPKAVDKDQYELFEDVNKPEITYEINSTPYYKKKDTESFEGGVVNFKLSSKLFHFLKDHARERAITKSHYKSFVGSLKENITHHTYGVVSEYCLNHYINDIYKNYGKSEMDMNVYALGDRHSPDIKVKNFGGVGVVSTKYGTPNCIPHIRIGNSRQNVDDTIKIMIEKNTKIVGGFHITSGYNFIQFFGFAPLAPEEGYFKNIKYQDNRGIRKYCDATKAIPATFLLRYMLQQHPSGTCVN